MSNGVMNWTRCRTVGGWLRECQIAKWRWKLEAAANRGANWSEFTGSNKALNVLKEQTSQFHNKREWTRIGKFTDPANTPDWNFELAHTNTQRQYSVVFGQPVTLSERGRELCTLGFECLSLLDCGPRLCGRWRHDLHYKASWYMLRANWLASCARRLLRYTCVCGTRQLAEAVRDAARCVHCRSSVKLWTPKRSPPMKTRL